MQIITLGTASCYPTSLRAVSCTALKFEDGQVWLFDCGEGSQVQLQKSSVKPSRITKIFITHLHGDHLFGLPGLLCTTGCLVPERNEFVLEIYGPKGLRKLVRQVMNLSRSSLTYHYTVNELVPTQEQYPSDWTEWTVDHEAEGELHPQEKLGNDVLADHDGVWLLFESSSVSVRAAAALHRVPSYGYTVTESDMPGKLDVELLKSLGIPPGPLYSKIKNGEDITLPSGDILHSHEALGVRKRGRKVTIVGDSCDSSRLKSIARNSDVVLHESTLENSMQQKAIEMGHSTPNMAAQFAIEVGAKMLILYHFSQRYKTEPTTENDAAVSTLLQEAAQELESHGSKCQVVLADDLKEINVPRPDT